MYEQCFDMLKNRLIDLTVCKSSKNNAANASAMMKTLRKIGPLPIIIPLQRSLMVKVPNKYEQVDTYCAFNDNELPTIHGMMQISYW
jgi:hypothetical protein